MAGHSPKRSGAVSAPVREQIPRSLSTLVNSAIRSRPSPSSRSAASLVRRAAAARRTRRYSGGVVVFADVREEQALLEQLARLCERREPLGAAHVAALARLAREVVPPPLGISLSELRMLAGIASPSNVPPTENPFGRRQR